MTHSPDAPAMVWNVRNTSANGSSGTPDRKNPKYQAITYVRTARNDGLHVWKAGAPLGPVADFWAIATAVGERTSGTIPKWSVKVWDLALRLDGLITDPGLRALVRLGEGWRFALVFQQTFGSRGAKSLVGLCQHDLPKKPGHIADHLGVCDLTLITRLGRFNTTQAEQLSVFAWSHGIFKLGVTSMPIKAGNKITRRHIR